MKFIFFLNTFNLSWDTLSLNFSTTFSFLLALHVFFFCNLWYECYSLLYLNKINYFCIVLITHRSISWDFTGSRASVGVYPVDHASIDSFACLSWEIVYCTNRSPIVLLRLHKLACISRWSIVSTLHLIPAIFGVI